MATDIEPDLILLTESWCNEEISNAFLTIPGYEIQQDLRLGRGDTAGGRGGGLLVYSKEGINILSLDKTVSFHQYSKFLVDDITVYLIYRPPSGGAKSIEDLATLISAAERQSIFIGDFNLPEIDWENGFARGRAAVLMEAAENTLMEQMVTFTTHIRGNRLDLLLTNVPERVVDVQEAGRLGHSDHSMILAKVNLNRQEVRKTKAQLDWNRADWTSMKADMAGVNWREELQNKSGSEAWDTFRDLLNSTVDKHVPERRKRNQNRPAWLTKEILCAIRRKKRLWTKAKHGENREEYEKEEKRVRKMIRNAKRKHEKKLADGGGKDSAAKRQFYAYVKQRTKTRPSIGPLKDKEGHVVSSDKDMANIFNEFFSGVFTREDTTNIPEPQQMNIGSEIGSVQVTVKKVKDKIRKLRRGAAAGPDNIGPALLQELVNEVASPLATIMRKSLEDSNMPADWKAANVCPIFKKGAKNNPGNYRPVSLTSVCCKMLESIVKDDIVRHLERNRLIRPSQHGFMRGRSCASNLLSFLEKVTAAVDDGEAVDIIFLDFAKAFDKVPVERLLKKVWAHGIRGQVFNWISSWLRDRQQRVVLNGEASLWAAVLSGVPQGSVLGPLLFLIFINDLDESCMAVETILKFADDTKIAQSIRCEADRKRLQEALDSLTNWADRWGMAFNVQKCKIMHVGHTNPGHEYTMSGTRLEDTEEERDLGVIMSRKLKPGPQCAKAARTAQSVLGQLARAFHFRDRHVFVKLYKSYVRPHLEFAGQAWAPWTAADKDILENVQRRAIKMVSGLKSASYEERLTELGMTTLEERRHQADMQYVYKILTGREDVDKGQWFTMASEAARNTRVMDHRLNVRVKHGRLDVRRNFFSVRVTGLWNKIPGHIKDLQTVVGFKTAYAKHRLNIAQRG